MRSPLPRIWPADQGRIVEDGDTLTHHGPDGTIVRIDHRDGLTITIERPDG